MSVSQRLTQHQHNKPWRVEWFTDLEPVTITALIEAFGEDGLEHIKLAVNTFDEAKAALEEAYHELRVRCGYTAGFHVYDTVKAALARMEGIP
mgnify:CR=1 FL=1